MIGAFLGDMIGRPYEFDRGNKTKEFPLFSSESRFTDDTVMTAAVAEAFLTAGNTENEQQITRALVKSMRSLGRTFPDAGYGGMFDCWLHNPALGPYGSFGNGSAMRVASVAWLYDTLLQVRNAARLSAGVTHNHPEGIKGAEATAVAIFLARKGSKKQQIKDVISAEYGYNLNRTCDEIRPTYSHVESCMQTVPEAITAFLEGDSFEDVLRTAVSLGGDCDTLAAIAGSIAEGYYGVPEELRRECLQRLPERLLQTVSAFEKVAYPRMERTE